MAEPTSARVEFDVPVPMRDGKRLFADVYRPAGEGRHPVILTRTPYDKSQAFGRAAGSGSLGMAAVRRGYAVVVQDTRGRFTSEGNFTPFVNEANDGHDTIEWSARQPWSNGKTGMFGGSYVGATQWLAATTRPPHLTAIAPFVTASDYHEGWAYQGGAFNLGFNVSWTIWALTGRNGGALMRRLGLTPERLEEMVDAADAMRDAFKALPLLKQPLIRSAEAGYYYDWMAHPADDAYWKALSIEDHHASISVPSLNVGGWYDIFLMGTIRNYTRMRQHGPSEAARSARLVIGPWSHTGLATNATGMIDYGQRAGATGLDLDALQLDWYDHWLGLKAAGNPGEPPVRIFVMGENKWRSENEWPLTRALRTRYYLQSNGRANTRRGDGALSVTPPVGGERPDSYLYDPMDPVPTRGGNICCAPWAGALPAGPLDQAGKEDRGDVLVYTTPPLDREVEVTGPVKATLWVSSSAPDTDFTAMLLDVAPSGEAINLCDGIVRGRYRASRERASLLTPGQVERIEIDLVATSNLFKQGHRIRLEVSSSNFPRFDRNLNTGKGSDSAEVAVATNTVYHDTARPSHIELDIVPR